MERLQDFSVFLPRLRDFFVERLRDIFGAEVANVTTVATVANVSRL